MPPGSSHDFSAVLLALEKNPRDLYLEVTSVLLRLANNVIKNPSEAKYRSIRLANPTVANKLLPAVGAMACLFEMGFQEAGDCLVLPQNCNLEKLKSIHDLIVSHRGNISTSAPGTSSSPAVSNVSPNAASDLTIRGQASSAVPQTGKNSSGSAKDSSVPKKQTSEKAVDSTESVTNACSSKSDKAPKGEFLERIGSACEIVSKSCTKENLDHAKACIPLVDLETAALGALRRIQQVIKKEQADEKGTVSVEPSMQELILVQLLSWFKEKFFSWVNNPSCHFCSGKTKFQRLTSKQNVRIEVYECALCFQETDFPRYTDVMKLLETRRGRCGEWGRCFTFLCHSLGWDSRIVIDETDHVWTEVFVASQSRWIHCDPCENAFDTPLMYELGWKKKLSYILAYSPDDVQDVTWRYSANHKDILKRRNFCTEAQLLEKIMTHRKLLQQNLSPTRKSYLLKRTLFDLVELWKEPSAKDGVYQGRQSGSLAWRISRGETSLSTKAEPYVWKPILREINKKEMQIQYLPGSDQYFRGTDSLESPISGWQNGVNSVSSIFRKEEKDWNMVYLAREEGCDVGKVTWSIDLSDSGLVADRVKLVLRSKIFETGQITALLCGGDCCIKVPTGTSETAFNTDALCGASLIKLTVDLKGGNGSAAWQHAQLFRSELDGNKVGLDLVINLKPA